VKKGIKLLLAIIVPILSIFAGSAFLASSLINQKAQAAPSPMEIYDGAIYLDNSSYTMSGGEITNHGRFNIRDDYDYYYQGGAISALNGSIVTISGGNIHDNKAGAGAGIYLNNSSLIMSGGSISNNIVKDHMGNLSSGAGIYATGNSTVEIRGGTISGNQAADGAGIYMWGGTLKVSGGTIADEIYLMNSSTFEYSAGTITGKIVNSGGTIKLLTKPTEVLKISIPNIAVGTIVATAENASYLDLTKFQVDNMPSETELRIEGNNVVVREKLYTVTIVPSGNGKGTVSHTSFQVKSGTRITNKNKILSIDGTSVTATPAPLDSTYSYIFQDFRIGSNHNYFSYHDVKSNVTIYAEFEKKYQFTVQSNYPEITGLLTTVVDNAIPLEYAYVNISSSSPNMITKYNGQLCTAPQTYTYNNYKYTFQGFYVGDTKLGTGQTTFSSNTTIIARYTRVYTKYTVTFDALGGSCSTTSKTITYGSTYGTLPTPTATNHIFKGWWTEKSGGSQIASSTVVTTTGNRTLYARWDTTANLIIYNETKGYRYYLTSGTSTTTNKYYTSANSLFAAALSDAVSGNVLRVLNSFTTSQRFTIKAGVTLTGNRVYSTSWSVITMDSGYLSCGNGVNLGDTYAKRRLNIQFSASNDNAYMEDYEFGGFIAPTGTLNIMNFGTASLNSTYYTIWNYYGATVNINAGTDGVGTQVAHGTQYGSAIYNYNGTVNINGGSVGVIINFATVNVNGGTLLNLNANKPNIQNEKTLVVNNGTFTTKYKYNITNSSSATIKLTGSTNALIISFPSSANVTNRQISKNFRTTSGLVQVYINGAIPGDDVNIWYVYDGASTYPSSLVNYLSHQDYYGSAYWNYDPSTKYLSTTCFDINTDILVWDDKKKRVVRKKAKDVKYSDKLLVWNFDKGCLDFAKPLFIQKHEFATNYVQITFSDGTKLNIAREHSVFNVDKNKFCPIVSDNEKYGCPVGTRVITNDGEQLTIVSKKRIHKNLEYTNIISDFHMNIYTNGILTSTPLNNCYPIENMMFVKDDRHCEDLSLLEGVDEKWIKGLRLDTKPDGVLRHMTSHDPAIESMKDYVQDKIDTMK